MTLAGFCEYEYGYFTVRLSVFMARTDSTLSFPAPFQTAVTVRLSPGSRWNPLWLI